LLEFLTFGVLGRELECILASSAALILATWASFYAIPNYLVLIAACYNNFVVYGSNSFELFSQISTPTS